MPRWRCRPSAIGMLAGAALAAAMGLGLRPLFERALRASANAEAERLVQGFGPPLVQALAQGDDLARIDVLQRLQKLPGVISAQAKTENSGVPGARPLYFEGKPVGWLSLRLTDTPMRRTRYAFWERVWTCGVCLGSVGALLGWRAEINRRGLFVRLKRLRKIRCKRVHIQKQIALRAMRDLGVSWTREAIAFSRDGLVLLDEHQAVVAANTRALRGFRLPGEVIGRHWLELQTSPEWVVALRQSLAFPGQRIAAPPGLDFSGASMLTLSPGATWIVLHDEASPAQNPVV